MSREPSVSGRPLSFGEYPLQIYAICIYPEIHYKRNSSRLADKILAFFYQLQKKPYCVCP